VTPGGARGARLEQAVREPAGRGAHVGAVPTLDRDVERVECVLELLAATRDEARALLDA